MEWNSMTAYKPEEEEEEEETPRMVYAVFCHSFRNPDASYCLYAFPAPVCNARKEDAKEAHHILTLNPPDFPKYMGIGCVGHDIYMIGGVWPDVRGFSQDVFILDTRCLSAADNPMDYVRRGRSRLNSAKILEPYVKFVCGKLFAIPSKFHRNPHYPHLGSEFLDLSSPDNQWVLIPNPTALDKDDFATAVDDFPLLGCSVIGSCIVVSVNGRQLYMLDGNNPLDGWKRLLSKPMVEESVSTNTESDPLFGRLLVPWFSLALLSHRPSHPCFFAWDLTRLLEITGQITSTSTATAEVNTPAPAPEGRKRWADRPRIIPTIDIDINDTSGRKKLRVLKLKVEFVRC